MIKGNPNGMSDVIAGHHYNSRSHYLPSGLFAITDMMTILDDIQE